MFTGMIEMLGRVERSVRTSAGLRLEVSFQKAVPKGTAGESIAVDGVCLTAAQRSSKGFTADVVRETLQSTTLGSLKAGQQVHLERALKLGARVGGHMVTGHVDGRGSVRDIRQEGRSKILWVQIPESIKNGLVPKGSIAVNGVSLTIQEIRERRVKIALVPHTLRETLLGKLKIKDTVNVESDHLLQLEQSGAKRETAVLIKKRLNTLIRQGF